MTNDMLNVEPSCILMFEGVDKTMLGTMQSKTYLVLYVPIIIHVCIYCPHFTMMI